MGIGITGLSDKPFRARMVEDWLRGRKLTAKSIEAAAALVVEDVEPLEDLHAAADYRAHLAQLFTCRAIDAAAKRAGGRGR
jgi:carbon-monoxide dehydrogenase medium subunit